MKLFRTSILSATHTFVKLVINVVVGKIFAVYLGPLGINQLGNFMNIFTILNNTMSGGIQSGIVKYTAEGKENKERMHEIIFNSIFFVLTFSLISALGYFVLIRKVNLILFNSQSISYLFLFGVLFAAFFSTIFNYFISILNGLGHIKSLTSLNILFSILLLISTILFVPKYYLKGVILSNLVAFVIVAFLAGYIIFKKYNFIFDLSMLNWKLNKKFLNYTFMSLTTIISVPLVQITLRNHYTSFYGIETAGIWQGLVRLSENYLSVFSIVLVTYFLPKYSETNDHRLIKNEIINGYKYLIPTLIIFFIFIYLFRFFIIKTLYSNQFLPISNYLPFLFLGDFFKISSWILAFLFLAKSQTKTFILSELFFSSILLLGTIALSKSHGIMGYVYSYILCYASYFVFCIFICKDYLFIKKS